MKAQQELPQASNQQTSLSTITEGSPFPRQLDRRKKTFQGTHGKYHYSKHDCNSPPTKFSIEAVLCEQNSAHAHGDTKQWMGSVKQWCVV